jgi:hypothetical protein
MCATPQNGGHFSALRNGSVPRMTQPLLWRSSVGSPPKRPRRLRVRGHRAAGPAVGMVRTAGWAAGGRCLRAPGRIGGQAFTRQGLAGAVLRRVGDLPRDGQQAAQDKRPR